MQRLLRGRYTVLRLISRKIRTGASPAVQRNGGPKHGNQELVFGDGSGVRHGGGGDVLVSRGGGETEGCALAGTDRRAAIAGGGRIGRGAAALRSGAGRGSATNVRMLCATEGRGRHE